MHFPIYTYLMWVSFHSPTPDIQFYNCPNAGQVEEYMWVQEQMEYKVHFDCPDRNVWTWMREANLQHVTMPNKEKHTCGK